MEVISLGMPRTGTKSMQSALHILGYNKIHHGFVLVDEPGTSNLWENAVDAKFYGKKPECSKEMFDNIFKGYVGTTDSPSAFFVEELLAFYPEVKVILVERDLNKWLASLRPLIKGIFGPKGGFILAIDNFLGYAGLRFYRKLYSAYFGSNDVEGILANVPRIYREHYEKVRRLVSPRRLLEYELGSGWEPLCEFLGKKKPDEQFPWVNEAAALQKKMLTVMAARVRELMTRFGWMPALLVLSFALIYTKMR